MKIYNKITLAWNKETERYDKVLLEDSFKYDGPMMLAQGETFVAQPGDIVTLDASNTTDEESCPDGNCADCQDTNGVLPCLYFYWDIISGANDLSLSSNYGNIITAAVPMDPQSFQYVIALSVTDTYDNPITVSEEYTIQIYDPTDQPVVKDILVYYSGFDIDV